MLLFFFFSILQLTASIHLQYLCRDTMSHIHIHFIHTAAFSVCFARSSRHADMPVTLMMVATLNANSTHFCLNWLWCCVLCWLLASYFQFGVCSMRQTATTTKWTVNKVAISRTSFRITQKRHKTRTHSSPQCDASTLIRMQTCPLCAIISMINESVVVVFSFFFFFFFFILLFLNRYKRTRITTFTNLIKLIHFFSSAWKGEWRHILKKIMYALMRWYRKILFK